MRIPKLNKPDINVVYAILEKAYGTDELRTLRQYWQANSYKKASSPKFKEWVVDYVISSFEELYEDERGVRDVDLARGR